MDFMDIKEKYKSMLTEIIAKQAIILGPDISVLKARSVPGLEVTNDGKVTNFEGDPKKVVQTLVDRYVELSGQIVKNALGSIFQKYPDISKGQ
ncbi:MAG: hypothetical protein ABIE43_03650 [Patescibacteria group bacterium]